MRKLWILSCAILAASCATPEFRAERQICEAEWLREIPPDYQRQLVNRTRFEERPTGVTNCHTVGNQTQCVQQTRTVSIPYTAVATVDINAPRRTAEIDACVVRACLARYDNPECAPPG